MLPAVVALTVSGPALAAPPEGWAPTEPVSPLSFLLVLVLIPGALFVVISLLSALPGMVRAEQTYQPGLAWRNEPEWFGGPRGGLDKSDEQPQIEASEDATQRGGASARW